jgi:PKD repeat protein
VGDRVGFTATTTPGGALIDAYTWNFGDGTDPETSQSFQVDHTYHSSGTKTVTACLTISGGGDTACGIGSVVVKP